MGWQVRFKIHLGLSKVITPQMQFTHKNHHFLGLISASIVF